MKQPMIEATEIAMVRGEGAARVEALKGINLSLAGGDLTLLMRPIRQRQDHAPVRAWMHVVADERKRANSRPLDQRAQRGRPG